MKLIVLLLTTATLLAITSPSGIAYPTSCCSIPTADILDAGAIRLELQNSGFAGTESSGATSDRLIELGLTPRLEVGFDQCDITGHGENSLNMKYLMSPESKSLPALAVGVMDISRGERPSYYGISTRTFGRSRVHAGYIHGDYAKGGMLGCDYALTKRTYLLADWMNGSENYSTVGIYQGIGKNANLLLAYGFPNEKGADQLLAINLNYIFKFSTGKR